jgi:prolyl oligopeptidase
MPSLRSASGSASGLARLSPALLAFSLGSAVFGAGCGSTQTVGDAGATGASGPKSGAPPTARIDDREKYHGVEVNDPYRWLEEPWTDEVKAFIETQNQWARGVLDKLPGREALNARLKEILGSETVSYSALREVKGQLFALKLQPPKQHAFLVVMPSPDAPQKERVVLDPDVFDPERKTSIDWYRVSPDGKLVAMSLSKGGSETGDLHIFDVASGKRVHEIIPRVNAGTAGGDLAWLRDSSGFYYSRYPRADERPPEDMLFFVQLYLHKLGKSPEKDTFELGNEFPRIAEVFVEVEPKTGAVLCSVQKGDGGEFLHFLKDPKAKVGAWRQIAEYEDRVLQVFFGEKNDLYAISVRDAPRGKLLRGEIAGFDIYNAKTVIRETDATLVADIWSAPLAVGGGRIYATYQLGGPSQIRVFDLDGNPQPGPELPPVSAVGDPLPLQSGDMLFSNVSFVEPLTFMRFTPKTGATTRTALQQKLPVDLSGVTVVREMATSKDGTKVPVNMLFPKGVAPGSKIPFLVTGYGGYGVNIEPTFQAQRSVFLDAGVGIAVVNLRGGGEFGEEWHKAGNLTNKQNVFDDFIAALEHLVKQGHAAQGKLAINGGSNGGLLMGAVITQRPELVAAVASFVGIYDMLRVETEPNGAFNVTEFGTVEEREQFDALYAYSPYHRVKDGAAYPPTLLLTGANDIRVAPWHSRKMAARLQAASSSSAPILLYTTFDAGHGIGSAIDTIVAQNTDAFSFLLANLGVTYASSSSRPGATAAR